MSDIHKNLITHLIDSVKNSKNFGPIYTLFYNTASAPHPWCTLIPERLSKNFKKLFCLKILF